MKILLITMEWPPFKGGVGNYYFNLVKNLPEVEIKVFQVSQNNFYKFFWPKWLKLYWEIKKLCYREKYDFIWVGQVLPIGEIAYLIFKKLGIKYFISTHGMDILLPQQNIRKDKILKKVLNCAEFITANSVFTKNELVNLNIPEQKIGVIYPCPNILNNHTSAKHEHAKILLSVGRLVKRKGQHKVIQAMHELLNKFPDLLYYIIGDGPEKTYLHDLIKQNQLQKQVLILDNITNEELPKYYNQADIFVLPVENLAGDAEGFGIVFLEASSFGLPIIAGKSGGAEEAVLDNQTGILIDPQNQNELLNKISLLLENQQLADKLGENGKTRVMHEFIWKKQADKLFNLIDIYGNRK